MGADPCYLTTNGKNIVTANYSGGSITVFPIGQDGALLPASDVIEFKGSVRTRTADDASPTLCTYYPRR